MADDSIEVRAQRRIDAFRLASLQGPVLQGPAPIQSPGLPTFSFFWSKLTPPRRLQCMKEIRAGVLKDWETKWDSGIESMGLTQPPPAERLLVYEGAYDDAHWAELKSKFPQAWEKADADYTRLQEQSRQGKLG